MNSTEYFNAVCLHYGKASEHEGKPVRIPRQYDPIIGKDVAEWIRAYAVKHTDFQSLFTKLTETYSVTYHALPDKAKMQKAFEALSESNVSTHRRVLETVTDEQREANVKFLEELRNDLKYGRHPERREPYATGD